jgi:hypothetical protein
VSLPLRTSKLLLVRLEAILLTPQPPLTLRPASTQEQRCLGRNHVDQSVTVLQEVRKQGLRHLAGTHPCLRASLPHREAQHGLAQARPPRTPAHCMPYR